MWITFLIAIFHHFSIIYSAENKLIIIPFNLKQIYSDPNYNSSLFINDHIFSNIFLELILGTPAKKVESKVDTNSKCFLMQTQNIDNPNDINNNNLYSPKLSTSIQKRTMKNFIDSMSFKSQKESYMIEFSFVDGKVNFNYSNYNYLPVLGLDIPQFEILDRNCPNFFVNVKKQKLINRYIWTLEFINDYEGNFVIGEELSIYNEGKYSSDDYYTTYSGLKNFIYFDSIYINNFEGEKNNNYYYINMTQSLININYGLIVAPHEYKELIDKLYFNDLFDKKVCKSDISFFEYNKRNHVGLNYFIYSCIDKQFTDKNNNYYNKFPELVFTLKSIEHNFIFSKEDLFVHINDKYYFLVVFQTNYDVKEIIWYLGKPFYKKYPPTFNFDAKTIGFYFKKGSDEIIDRSTEKENIQKNNNRFIIIIVFEAVIIIVLFILIIFFAKYIREIRKNRVNEINDDNYEYFSENNNNKMVDSINN